jgi:hypothetical protein
MPRLRTWFSRSRLGLFSGGIVSLLAFSIFFSGYAASTADALTAQPKVLVEMSAISPLLSYQGRLLDPATGAPKPNGTYTFVFRIYNVASDGSALWTETKDLNVSNGLFVTLLGDTTPLPTTIFTGQNLWLGIKVGTDAEATPRQRLAPVAYAMYADNADRLDGQDSTYFRNASNINAGTLADAHIPAAITRDNEVMTIVKANDGSGSGVDADLLDGLDSTAFFKGDNNVQVPNTTLNPGGSVTWTSWGYNPNHMVIWWATPKTLGGKLSISVETELEPCCGQGQGLIRYFITVRNTGSVTTTYDLIRYRFNQ